MTQRKIALSIEEAADYTGIGRNTLRKLVEWKKLPVLKVGRKVLIKTDNSNESSASTHICKFPSRYNLAYSNGSSIASDVKAQSDPGVVLKFFSASQQSIRSI